MSSARPASFPSSPVSSSVSETSILDLHCTGFFLTTFLEALVVGPAGLVGVVLALALRDVTAGVTSPISKLESDPSANRVRLDKPFVGRVSDLLPDEITVIESECFLDAPCRYGGGDYRGFAFFDNCESHLVGSTMALRIKLMLTITITELQEGDRCLRVQEGVP